MDAIQLLESRWLDRYNAPDDALPLIHAITKIYAVEAMAQSDAGSVVEKLRSLFTSTAPSERAAMVRASAAFRLIKHPREFSEGLAVVEQVIDLYHRIKQRSPYFFARLQILYALRALLSGGSAEQASSVGDRALAADLFLVAAAAFLDANLNDHAMTAFRSIEAVLGTDFRDVDLFAERLANVSVSLASRTGDWSSHLARKYWYPILCQPIGGQALLAFEVGKGAAFSRALRDGGAKEAIQSADWAAQLEATRSLPPDTEAKLDVSVEHVDDDELLLSATGGQWSGRGNPDGHGKALIEMRTKLDAMLLGVGHQANFPKQPFLGVGKIMALLDQRTVLVSLLDLPTELVSGDNTNHELHILVLTRNSLQLFQVEGVGKHFLTGWMDRSFDRFASLVSGWRQQLQWEQGFSQTSQLLSGCWEMPPHKCDTEFEAAEAVASQMLPPKFFEYLHALNSEGKDHLLLHPHGSLHFCPFHLLVSNGRRIADDWLVTYIPCITLLDRAPVQSRSAQDGPEIAVVGVTHADEGNGSVVELPGASREAAAIASIFSVEPIVEENVTRERFLQVLGTTRYLHVAAHSAQCPYAPAFQRVILNGDGTGTGAIYAYEFLEKDLRGVDLISFSACDSGLGRFDWSDNLRGLSAMCFLAGAATLIGTMWNVADEVAETFFVVFYHGLRQGRSKIDAFGDAQRETRGRFAAASDWGAFQLVGYPYG